MAKRFASDVNVPHLLSNKYAKKTTYMNAYAQKLLESFLRFKNITVDYTNAQELDELLCQFYAHVRKEDGEYFSMNTFTSLRYAIARKMKDDHALDIVNGPEFTKSSQVFQAMKAELKKNGKGIVKHYPIISPEDLLKIASMDVGNPTGLQLKVWFTLHMHFVLRGRENLHGLTKSDLVFRQANSKMSWHNKCGTTLQNNLYITQMVLRLFL